MKKLFVICLLVIGKNVLVSAQTSATYTAAIESRLKILDTATQTATFANLAQEFENIGQGWEAWYYAAYTNINMLNTLADRSSSDPIIDKAEKLIKQAAALKPDNSEITLVQAMVVYSRVLVSPRERWQQLNVGDAFLDKAKKLDPTNPRPYLIEAKAKLNTPEMLGGGTDAAKAALQSFFDKFRTFQPAGSIAPHWGESTAIKMQKKLATL